MALTPYYWNDRYEELLDELRRERRRRSGR